MGQIFGVGAPGKIRTAGTIYVDTRSGLSYKQDRVPRGSSWTLVDNNASDDSASSTPLTYCKIYSKNYTIYGSTLSAFFSSPIALETLTTEDGNPGNFIFLGCHSVFKLNGDTAGYDTTQNIIKLSHNNSEIIYKTDLSMVTSELSPTNLLIEWYKNDIYELLVNGPFTAGTPGPKSSIDLTLSGDEDLTLYGFGFWSITIYVTYTIIQ